MYNLKRLLVGLDLTEMDETLIRYAAFISTRPTIEKVIFIHTEKHLDLPEELLHGMQRESQPTEVTILEAIEAKVAKYFGKLQHIQTEVRVLEGGPVKEMLRVVKQEEVNLMLVGRKLHLRGSGVLPQKLLRSGKVSVLFIPENAEPVTKKAVVSIDFSEYSMMALDRMLHSAIDRPDMLIECLHVYEVPSGYITLGESYKDFDNRMKGYAEEKFEQVLEQLPEMRGRASLKLVKKEYNDDLGEIVVIEAKRAQADLLVIGAKGKSAEALFMVGSVTEKILRHNADIPLLVFRNEKEETGFLDALLNS